MNDLERASLVLSTLYRWLPPSLIIMPVSVQSSWNFYEHWSGSIDFSLSHTLFFFTRQIFEILISGVSEFLGDEMLSSETAGNKMKKLAPRQRAPALSVLSKPCVFIIVHPLFCSNQAWNSKRCSITKFVLYQLIFLNLNFQKSFSFERFSSASRVSQTVCFFSFFPLILKF